MLASSALQYRYNNKLEEIQDNIIKGEIPGILSRSPLYASSEQLGQIKMVILNYLYHEIVTS